MGLSSLKILNKLGYNNYWLNSFQNNKTYNRMLNNSISIETIVSKLIEERTFIRYINSNSNALFHSSKIKNLGQLPNQLVSGVYCGEIWFLYYANTVVISPLFFNTAVLNDKKIRVRVTPYLLSFFYLFYYNFF
mgnify:FL=1